MGVKNDMNNKTFFSLLREDSLSKDSKGLLDKFLSRCILYTSHYSLSNNATIQAEMPEATYVFGKEDWEKQGGVLRLNACPLEITAPVVQNKTVKFVKVEVYDISQTNLTPSISPWLNLTDEKKLALITTFCHQAKINVVIREFKAAYPSRIYYSAADRTFYLKKGTSAKAMTALLLKELFVWQMQNQKGMISDVAEKISSLSTFMIMQWLGDGNESINPRTKAEFYQLKDSYQNLKLTFEFGNRFKKALRKIIG